LSIILYTENIERKSLIFRAGYKGVFSRSTLEWVVSSSVAEQHHCGAAPGPAKIPRWEYDASPRPAPAGKIMQSGLHNTGF
jgi:hypothetical protein